MTLTSRAFYFFFSPSMIYEYLRMQVHGKKISWNFNKFFISKSGQVVDGPLGDDAYADKVAPIIDNLLQEE